MPAIKPAPVSTSLSMSAAEAAAPTPSPPKRSERRKSFQQGESPRSRRTSNNSAGEESPRSRRTSNNSAAEESPRSRRGSSSGRKSRRASFDKVKNEHADSFDHSSIDDLASAVLAALQVSHADGGPDSARTTAVAAAEAEAPDDEAAATAPPAKTPGAGVKEKARLFLEELLAPASCGRDKF